MIEYVKKVLKPEGKRNLNDLLKQEIHFVDNKTKTELIEKVKLEKIYWNKYKNEIPTKSSNLGTAEIKTILLLKQIGIRNKEIETFAVEGIMKDDEVEITYVKQNTFRDNQHRYWILEEPKVFYVIDDDNEKCIGILIKEFVNIETTSDWY